jgi:cell division protein FtsQ
MKKTLLSILWISIAVALAAGLFFARKYYNEKPCTKLNIKIDYDQGEKKTDVFLTYEDIRKFIRHSFDSIVGRPMGSISVEELEHKAEKIPYVLEADAFKSINGEVTLNIRQRRAIVLVIDQENKKYYIDETGEVIPPRPGFPADILVCNGNIPHYKFYGENQNAAFKDSIMQHSILGDIYTLARKLDANPFLHQEITQLYVTPKGEFYMVPLVGRHKILLGSIDNVDEKLENLEEFYKQAKKFDAWGKYKIINLKYKNQIVCTKYY